MNWLNTLRDNMVAQQRLYTLIAVGVIVLIGLGYVLLYALGMAPQLSQRDALLTQLTVVQQQALQKQRAQRTSPEDVQAAISQAEADLEEAAQAFLAETQAADLLDRLYQYAQQNGVTVLRLESAAAEGADEANPYYSASAFALDVQGYLPDLLAFLGSIQEAGRPSVQIGGVKIPEAESNTQLLTMSITLYTSPLATAELPPTAPGLTLPEGPSAGTSRSMTELQNTLEVAQSEGRWEDAIQILARMRALDPNDEQVLAQLYQAHVAYGNQLIEEGRAQKAIVQFNLALNVQPNAPEALEGLQRAAALDLTPTAVGALPEGTPGAETTPGAATPAADATPAATATSALVRPTTWPTEWPWPPSSGGQ